MSDCSTPEFSRPSRRARPAQRGRQACRSRPPRRCRCSPPPCPDCCCPSPALATDGRRTCRSWSQKSSTLNRPNTFSCALATQFALLSSVERITKNGACTSSCRFRESTRPRSAGSTARASRQLRSSRIEGDPRDEIVREQRAARAVRRYRSTDRTSASSEAPEIAAAHRLGRHRHGPAQELPIARCLHSSRSRTACSERPDRQPCHRTGCSATIPFGVTGRREIVLRP